MIAGAKTNEDPQAAMPTMAEMCVLLWYMTSQTDKCPWKSQEKMMDSVDAAEIMACYDDIISFFLGVDVSGMKSFSDLSTSDSAPETGEN